MQFENVVVIDRPVEEVFAYLADFSNVPEWNYAIEETRQVSPGPVGVGAEYRQTRSLPRPSEETFVVAEYEPNQKLAIEGDLGPYFGTLSYELQSSASGTEVRNAADLEGQGVLKIAGGLLGGRIREAVGQNLQKLKQLLESR